MQNNGQMGSAFICYSGRINVFSFLKKKKDLVFPTINYDLMFVQGFHREITARII